MYVAAVPCRYVRSFQYSDIDIAFSLRQDDVNEIHAATGKYPYQQLRDTLILDADRASRRTYTMLSPVTGKPFGLFGDTLEGLVWLVSTPEIERHSITFLRESRKWINYFHNFHPILWNYVDARQTLHIKWLTKWLGFTIEGKTYKNDMLFHLVIHKKEE